MKKLLIAIVACVATLGILAKAEVAQTSESIDVFINDADFKEAVIARVNQVVADIASTLEFVNVQIDTNATTTATLYAPTGVGSLLVGKQGGSNRVWIATGTTTNDWGAKVLND